VKTLDRPQEFATKPLDASKYSSARQDWIDNLRTAMILLVVNMHACVTYSYVGSWYYNAPPEPSIPAKIPFLEWQAHLQAFFMGLLFFIGGYYADRSLTRRGTKAFLGERVRRLGLPALLYMVAIHPFIVMILHPGYPASQTPGKDYLAYLSSGRFLGSSGPMWFAVALLIFSLLLAMVARRIPKIDSGPFQLRVKHVVMLGVGIGFASFLVRTIQPLGSSILNMQLCYFPQYIVVFILGVWASRRDVLASLAASPISNKAGLWALILGPITLIGVVAASLPIPDHGPAKFVGGWNPVAFGLATWEQLVGVSLGLGCMWLCAARLNLRTRLSAWLADRSFGVYLFHPPILVGLALLMQPYRTNPYVMTIILTVVGLVASFAVADLARRIPLLNKIL